MNPPVYTISKIGEDLEKKFRESMLHDSIIPSRLMVHVKQLEESKKRKHIRAGNMSR